MYCTCRITPTRFLTFVCRGMFARTLLVVLLGRASAAKPKCSTQVRLACRVHASQTGQLKRACVHCAPLDRCGAIRPRPHSALTDAFSLCATHALLPNTKHR